MIRIGIDGNRKHVMARIRDLRAPVLVSANSLWNDALGRFGDGWQAYMGLDVALDSGGFVAMIKYGRFRFGCLDYAQLAAAMQPTWWAQMDYCCEPEIASNPGSVAQRIDMTAKGLENCESAARDTGAIQPMIVLQGWSPDDYCRGPIYDRHFEWPSLVGVGSVCRRNIYGKDGLLAVLAAIDQVLPPHVKLHFFGVKGAALDAIGSHPRFASMDSSAWNYDARRIKGRKSEREARKKYRQVLPDRFVDGEFKASRMADWYLRQEQKLNQMALL
jgi:hypothetical protein